MSKRAEPLAPGVLVGGRYRVLAPIAVGALAEVHRAEPVGGGAPVALKLLREEVPGAGEIAARFAREAQAAGRLRHENVVELHDVGAHEDGRLFLVMELCGGRSLAELLAGQARVAAPRAVAIVRQVLGGLAAAHAIGVIHRDLKPHNVMIDDADRVKLLDFGLVKLVGESALTQRGMVIGTPAYMAPEQALGQPVDARTDLYAAGLLLFELCAGRRPFPGDDPMTLMRLHMTEAPPALAVAAPGITLPDGLDALIARALAKQPGDRFESAAVMTAALDALRF